MNVCELNKDVTEYFLNKDVNFNVDKYEKRLKNIKNINEYLPYTKKILYLLSGCVDESSYSFKKYSVGRIKTNSFRLKDLELLVTVLKYEEDHNFTVENDYWDMVHYAAKSKNRLSSLIVGEYRDYYLETQVFPLLYEYTGRKYELEYWNDDWYLIAKDETVSEFMKRTKNGWSLWFILFPILGQIFLMFLMYYFIVALFTKEWSIKIES